MRFFNSFFIKIFLIIFLIVIIILSSSRYNFNRIRIVKNYAFQNIDVNNHSRILWWTPISKGVHHDRIRKCGDFTCLFTENRDMLLKHNISTYIFYGTEFNPLDLPLPRNNHDIWALYHEESPKNLPLFIYEDAINLFNYTSTFSHFSSIPKTLQYIHDISNIVDSDYLEKVSMKNFYQKSENLAPILYIQSICNTITGRNEFINELQKHIRIDSFGKCSNNKKLPSALKENYLNNLRSPEFLKFIARYKFVIAIENGVCNDYMTEKLWRPLEVGVVPIYFGAPNVKEWLPNGKSAILIDDYPNAKSLAKYIKYLNNNDEEYLKYLDHKYNVIAPINNTRLLFYYYTRIKFTDALEEFECFLCNIVNRKSLKSPEIIVANHHHYNCPKKAVFPKMLTNITIKSEKEWNNIFSHAACNARVLHSFVQLNRNYSANEFHKEVSKSHKNDDCKQISRK